MIYTAFLVKNTPLSISPTYQLPTFYLPNFERINPPCRNSGNGF
jgi:hypothetical protein